VDLATSVALFPVPEDDNQAREAGADDYVVKTLDNKYLMQTINFVAKNDE